MPNLFKVFLSVSIICIVTLSAAEGKPVKLGVVNIALLLEGSPQAKLADAKLKKEFTLEQSELKSLAVRLEKQQAKYQKNKAIMKASQKVSKERAIGMLTREIQRRRNDLQELLNLRRNEELIILQNIVNNAIKTIGKKQGFDLILYEGIAYTNNRIDVTADVLKQLKADRKKQRSKVNK